MANGARYRGATTARRMGLGRYYDSAEISPSGAPQPPAYESAVAPPLGPGGDTYYFRNLFILDQVAQDPAYRTEAESFAAYMWAQRQPATGLIDPQYGVNGTAPMVEIYSLLAGSPPTP